MKTVSAFLAGVLFAAGLVISGMTQPEYIIGFLDFFGAWNPALAWVMAGAVGVYAAIYPLVMKRRAPLFESAFDVPAKQAIDLKLVIGSAAFGLGWGLNGFCPGPALVALGAGAAPAAVFTAAMVLGIFLHNVAVSGPSGTPDNSCG